MQKLFYVLNSLMFIELIKVRTGPQENLCRLLQQCPSLSTDQ